MDDLDGKPTAVRYRSIWISDVHLGFPGCSADYLLEFLRSSQCDTLYTGQ